MVENVGATVTTTLVVGVTYTILVGGYGAMRYQMWRVDQME